MVTSTYTNLGEIISHIPVRISYRIIQLFSEGLYSSPTKAIEELVANSFDAGARHVHVLLTPDLTTPQATIAVVDDGQSMDEQGLKQHWLVGTSNKRDLVQTPLGRKQIGRFGIGKLATFVLSSTFTHICKKDGCYYAATMDYSQIPHGISGGINPKDEVELPLRKLSEEEARAALPPLVWGELPGHSAIPLFGPDAASSWTVAILSDLKPMAAEVKIGRLWWVLRTAMPLNPDFNLFLDGNPVESTKVDVPVQKEWVLGKDIVSLKDLEGIEPNYVPSAAPVQQYGLVLPLLGRVTGTLRLFKDKISEGKSRDWGRSHGFFIYVRGRLLNADEDPNFGIPPNVLRHGTMAKFRADIHIDSLDDELRSSRESVRNAQLTEYTRTFLQAVFRVVRNYDEDEERKQDPNQRITNKIQQAPGSLTRRPIANLVEKALKGDAVPKLLSYPKDLPKAQAEEFVKDFEERAQSVSGLVVRIETRDLPPDSGVAVFDTESGTLEKNANHPLISTFAEDPVARDLVSLVSMAEVLTEAFLYKANLTNEQVREIMGKRDELLRSFARSTVRRTASSVARDLIDASTDKRQLELEVVAAFDMLGFEAEHLGGSGKPDGIARAAIGRNQYKLSLEAKSKENPDGTVSARAVAVSAVSRQRDDFGCNHAVVVAPGYATANGDEAAVVREARKDKEIRKDEGKTITLMAVQDLARLVRLAALKPMGLDTLRSLFTECVSPDEVRLWVDKIEQTPRAAQVPYKEVLDSIWYLQGDTPDEPVEFAFLRSYLKFQKNLPVGNEELVDICKAMQRFVPEGVVTREQSVELRMRPQKILDIAGTNLKQYPQDQQKLSNW